MPKWLVSRKASTIVIISIVGLVLGSFLSGALLAMPDSVVKTTFTYPFEIISIGYPNPLLIDLVIFKFQIGIQLQLTLLSFVGLGISLWMYRWFE